MTVGGRARVIAIAAVVAGAVAAVCTTAATLPPEHVPLAPLVAAWPTSYDVSGAKSEPLYTERIRIQRNGDEFALRIEVRSQGDRTLGVQSHRLHVEGSAVVWDEGCTKSAGLCTDDTTLRGFLSTALIVARAHAGELPEFGIRRELHGTPVVCIDDVGLHPDSPASIPIEPCLDLASGAVLGHWSPESHAFVGPTLADGFRVTLPAPAPLP